MLKYFKIEKDTTRIIRSVFVVTKEELIEVGTEELRTT